ncbi:hypothetical protein N7G274_005561 [Stereocaulon virgatum]|uniref:Uncharacterized protein n=1 Tax=Stereocaulon virgatum TaxID=373712 RepID=A0ABR4ABB1_9LECA
MPIKWTPEIDQILLLKILETSQVNADVKAIAAAWPTNHEKPTPRAITERLVKIRNGSKATGTASHFSVSGSKTGSQGGTPRKPRVQNPNGVKKNTTPKKDRRRRRAGRMSDEDLTDDSETEVDFKSENNIAHVSDNNDESPSKKARTGGKANVKVEAEDAHFHDGGFGNSFHDNGAEDMEEDMYA